MVARNNTFTIEDGIPQEATFKREPFKITPDDTYFDNISNAIVSFLSLSKRLNRSDIYSSSEDIRQKGSMDPEFRRILKQEVDCKIKSSQNESNKLMEKDLKRYLSPRDFIKETAPKHWNVANFQNSLSNWQERLKVKFGIALDFDISIIFNHSKGQANLNINDQSYNLNSDLVKWEKSIENYRKDDYWQEILESEKIEIPGEESIKAIELILLNALSKNVGSRYHEFLWLAYKTCEKFTIFKEIDNNFYQIFIKEGNILISMKL